MLSQLTARRVSITIAHALIIAIIAGAAFAAGLFLRPWDSSAAPGGMLEACISRYTGAVRMSPTGTTNCSAVETKASWPAGYGAPSFRVERVEFNVPGETTPTVRIAGAYCDEGEVATGGGFNTPESELTIIASYPYALTPAPPHGWQVNILTGAQPKYGWVWAVCMSPAS